MKIRFISKVKQNKNGIVCKLGEWIITGFILATISAIVTSSILNCMEKHRIINEEINNISNIYIGCNKDWVDDRFGYPQFSSQKGEYLLCAYSSEYYMLQFAFDKYESAQAYLITALENNKDMQIVINDTTLGSNNQLCLGDFSYYDFPFTPIEVYGYATNGAGRYLYSETYYYAGGGGYYNYHIATLDYGIYFKNAIFEALSQNIDVDDEVNSNMNQGFLSLVNRNECAPNSYGVSVVGFDMKNTLFEYSWFNSQQLRNKVD